MKTVFIPMLWGATLLALTGCGVSSTELGEADELAAEAEQELSTTKDSYIIARRDYRRCLAPLCGGYWVKDLNSTMAERYVSEFDFTDSSMPADLQQVVTSSPDLELVLFGRLGPKEPRFDTRAFRVKLAYRGMPGKAFAATDKFYGVFPSKIACFREPCANLQTTRLNRKTGHVMATGLDLTGALAPFVNPDWLLSRALSGKTVIAGRIVRRGEHITVTASQVFVELPDRVAPCASSTAPECTAGQIAAFERTSDRCTVATGTCTAPGVCPRFFPRCEPGYRMVSWMNVCPRYACEPEFLPE